MFSRSLAAARSLQLAAITAALIGTGTSLADSTGGVPRADVPPTPELPAPTGSGADVPRDGSFEQWIHAAPNNGGDTYDGSDFSLIVLYMEAWLSGDEWADLNNSGGTPDAEDMALFFELLSGGLP